jgi:hypothetical protein
MVKKFFQALWGLMTIVFFPIISFRWARYALVESARGYYWRFFATGVAGIIGGALYVCTYFAPMSWKFFWALIATLFYGGGSWILFRMIAAVINSRAARTLENMMNRGGSIWDGEETI